MDNWHFPRLELAEHYLGLLSLGISSNFAIVAPRRRGKTLFVLQDLAPLARKKDYLPVYASLWQNINKPHEGLIVALEEAIASLDKRTPFSRLLQAKIRKASVSNEILGSMEIEFADKPVSASSEELSYLELLLGRLEAKAGKKSILLLIDEVQHLSTSSQFDPLAHALRTMLDKRQGRVKSIFTGSSRHYMNLLFNESQSPFYHFVELLPFPELTEEFVRFLRDKLASEYGIAVSLVSLTKAFDQLDRSPHWMMKLISHLITYKRGLNDSLEFILQLMEAAEGLEATATKMKAIDRVVFLGLCEGLSPFSQEMLARVDSQTEVKGIAPNVQRALSRLSEANLISQIQKGQYNIEKPGLRRFLTQEGSSRT
jgi:hypothetical protein